LQEAAVNQIKHYPIMKFLPTIDINNYAMQEAIRNGQIKLQVGQWLKIDNSGHLSRFVCVRGKSSIWAVHPYQEKGISKKRFSETCAKWLSR
jgi:hypothetical protein